VDLVDDDGAHRLEHLATAAGRQQDEERLGGRHEQMRRPAEVGAALSGRRVPGSDGGADLHVWQAEPGQLAPDPRQRLL
jgi:hypothetical protein